RIRADCREKQDGDGHMLPRGVAKVERGAVDRRRSCVRGVDADLQGLRGAWATAEAEHGEEKERRRPASRHRGRRVYGSVPAEAGLAFGKNDRTMRSGEKPQLAPTMMPFCKAWKFWPQTLQM